MRLLTNIFVMLFAVITNITMGQDHELDWVRTYDGPYHVYDRAYDIILDDAGNIYVTGSINENWDPIISPDILTIKYNPEGVILWARSFDSGGYDEAYLIEIDSQGFIYAAGNSSGNEVDYFVIKHTSDGDTIWTFRYDGPNHDDDEVADMTVDQYGNVYLTGESWAGDYYDEDIATMKIYPDGELAWVQRFNGDANYDDIGSKIKVDQEGNVYVAGLSFRTGSNYDIILIKYNQDGVEQWINYFNGPLNYEDYVADMVTDDFLNFYITGPGNGYYSHYDIVTVKFDSNGELVWSDVYNGTGDFSDESIAIDIDGSGNCYVTGFSNRDEEYNTVPGDIITIKYDPSGNIEWERFFDGPGTWQDYANDLVLDQSGNVYVTGIMSDTSGSVNITLQYNAEGDLLWESSYNCRNNAITIDNDMNIYLTGQVAQYDTSTYPSDFITMKYSISSDINNQNICQRPVRYLTNQNYPNPFNASTVIRYDLPYQSRVIIDIYNILGRKVSTLVDKQQPPGYHQVIWRADDFASGMYFYKMQAGDHVETKKMVLMK